MAYTYPRSIADLHAVAHVYSVADSDLWPNVYPMADFNADTCPDRYSYPDTGTGCDCANANTGANSYGSTYTNSHSANGDTGANS